MKLILPIVGMLISAASTLMAVVFCLAMGANSTPAQIRMIKLWMSGFSLLGLAGIVAAILMLRAGQTGWASGAAFLPAVVIVIVFIVAMLK